MLFPADGIRSKELITCTYGYGPLRAMDKLDNDIKAVPKDIPVFIISFNRDILCYCCVSLKFYNGLHIKNKEMRTQADMEHTIIWYLGNQKVSKKIVGWIMGLF
ncbi:hypothetical protein C922_03734 [Plasmodium inui San Antonio 1]|uniref:Serine aminopeptidase S33 domain-containing protein n=1 Tax=Plasmodium inui San Antonio 1 TaxID=1237626 RepID=W7AK99_9APIC|nr:hypothetical protein C922_03734 [Plasmodium inui San Antonio 1]EUD65751.1 hypothetical protein C922_03734 [Plasmodium inui San Antonio 1]